MKTDETKEKMSKAKMGENNPNFNKFGRENKSAKQVLQFDFDGNLIASYHSITKASELTGINISSIGMVCKKQRKTAGGFIWKYGYHRKNNVSH